MKKFKNIVLIILPILVVLAFVLYFALQPVWELSKAPSFKGSNDAAWLRPAYDSSKKTIFIVADNDGTEMFDLMAPFYLFNATEKTNVYIIAEKKSPILLVNSLFILPHYTFAETDSLPIHPDVIVVPNQSVKIGKPQKTATVNWIKNHYTDTTIILSICDGSATAAATGIYDGKPLTTHASDYDKVKKQFPKPAWVKNVSVTESGNLYSTAGVSNAVEGSLTVIKKLFGDETMQKVLQNVQYPHPQIKIAHQSEAINTGALVKGLSKVLFKKNNKIGVILNNSINEFILASILDTYVRSVPASIKTFSVNNTKVISKYGLALYPTGDLKKDIVDEIHIVNPESFSLSDEKGFGKTSVIRYNETQQQYPINICLDRIAQQYGSGFQHLVKLMLDYN